MSKPALKVLAVAGSLNSKSATRAVVHHAARLLQADGCHVDILDLEKEPLAIFNPETARDCAEYASIQARVDAADVLLLGTPDYHGSMSGAMKNFLDHFWHEFAGKLFVTIVASHEKGLTVTDQLRTVARQCYAWTLPYGVSFTDGEDIKNGEIVGASFAKRLEMLIRDTRVYGEMLSHQRRADLSGTDPCFLARLRRK